MDKAKRRISLLLVVALLCGLLSTAVRAENVLFADVNEQDWFYEAVSYVWDAGLMNGTGGGRFSPNGSVTRGMAVTILWRLDGERSCGKLAFSDVAAGAWYADAVAWAAAEEIVTGYSATRFGPDDAVTREQLAVMLYRYASYAGENMEATADLSSYDDANAISIWAEEAMAWAVAAGILTGKGAERLDPAGTATRAEFATILMRMDVAEQEEVREEPAHTRPDYDYILPENGGKIPNGLVIPSEENLFYDQENHALYYNNLISAFTVGNLSYSESQRLAELIDGTVVGSLSDSLSLLQFSIEDADYDTLCSKIDILNQQETIQYAYYEFPSMNSELSGDSNPWSDGRTADSDRGNEEKPGGNDWWAEAIGAYTSWKLADEYYQKNNISGVTRICIGVIDSGFDEDHEDLDNTISIVDRVSGLKGTVPNTEGNHGTGVAGILAAENNTVGIRGVCDTASLMCLDYDGFSGDFTASVSATVDHMFSNGVKVLNASFGEFVYSKFTYIVNKNEYEDLKAFKDVSYEDYLETMRNSAENTARISVAEICNLLEKGRDDFLIVPAAGNGYDNGGAGYEAFLYTGRWCSITENLFNEMNAEGSIPKGITFEDIDHHILVAGAAELEISNGKQKYELTDYSCYGETVEICAPVLYDGSKCATTAVGDKYRKMAGTSSAAPMVAGAAAQLWSINPTLSAEEVHDYLLANCKYAAKGKYDETKYAQYLVLNVGEAVTAVLEDMDELPGNDTILFGKVRNSVNKQTLAGVEVSMYDRDGKTLLHSDTTDSSGEYEITGITEGDYVVRFAKSGYETSEVFLSVDQGVEVEYDHELVPTTKKETILSGKIRDSVTKLALPGVLVSVYDQDGKQRLYSDATDSNGKYEIEMGEIGSSDYDLVFEKTGYKRVTLDDVLVYGEHEESLDLTPALSGKVVDEDGQPVSGVEVYANYSLEPVDTTGKKGIYVLPVMDGTYELMFVKEGYETQTVSDVVVKALNPKTLNITMAVEKEEEESHTISGYVKTYDEDDDLVKLAGVKVRIYDEDGDELSELATTTAETGGYSMQVPEAGDYTLKFSKSGYTSKTLNVEVENLTLVPDVILMKQEEFAGGSGTESDPYLIATAKQLDKVRHKYWCHYRLIDDIDLSNYDSWEPIDMFTGSLDGDGYAIENLTITELNEDFNAGLFDALLGSVYDLDLLDVYIDITESVGCENGVHVGALAATSNSNPDAPVVISNCYASGSIDVVIRGYDNDPTPDTTIHCSFGGLIGYASGIQVEECTNYCTLYIQRLAAKRSGTRYVHNGQFSIGGILGTSSEMLFDMDYRGELLECVNCGDIIVENEGPALDNVGGIVGSGSGTDAEDCVNHGDIEWSTANCEEDEWTSGCAGGIAGRIYNQSKLLQCENYGDVDVMVDETYQVNNLASAGICGEAVRSSSQSQANTIKNCTNYGMRIRAYCPDGGYSYLVGRILGSTVGSSSGYLNLTGNYSDPDTKVNASIPEEEIGHDKRNGEDLD